MIAVGVDTHKERHFAVVLNQLGELLGELVIDVCAAGYGELERWAAGFAPDAQQIVFGIEGAGSWGAGLCEHLQRCGCMVVEVERPRRRDRRAGKSDRIDALAAAKRVLVGEGTSTPRQRGILSVLRALLVAQRSATCERTRLLNEIQALHATAPFALRERVGEGSGKQLERRLGGMRTRASAPVDERAVFAVMRDLAARSRALAVDARRYERELADVVRSLDPTLLREVGVGPISAAKLLVWRVSEPRVRGAVVARCLLGGGDDGRPRGAGLPSRPEEVVSVDTGEAQRRSTCGPTPRARGLLPLSHPLRPSRSLPQHRLGLHVP